LLYSPAAHCAAGAAALVEALRGVLAALIYIDHDVESPGG